LIGRECKSSNAFSGPVLIGRGLVPKSKKFHYAVLKEQQQKTIIKIRICLKPPNISKFLVGIAEGPHPFPSRTRKLSPPAPMVLGARAPGRVGPRRKTYFLKRPPFEQKGGLNFIRLKNIKLEKVSHKLISK
jgi:hypothetical protein